MIIATEVVSSRFYIKPTSSISLSRRNLALQLAKTIADMDDFLDNNGFRKRALTSKEAPGEGCDETDLDEQADYSLSSSEHY